MRVTGRWNSRYDFPRVLAAQSLWMGAGALTPTNQVLEVQYVTTQFLKYMRQWRIWIEIFVMKYRVVVSHNDHYDG
jgi:hypothetical protein